MVNLPFQISMQLNYSVELIWRNLDFKANPCLHICCFPTKSFSDKISTGNQPINFEFLHVDTV